MQARNRITRHPVLSEPEDIPEEEARLIEFSFEGRTMQGVEGEPIAAALTAAGIFELRRSHRFDEPRGIYCGIGQCQDCVMVVDGVPNVRTCVEPLREGMDVRRQIGRAGM